METDIFFYTTTYLTARLAIVAAFAYGFYCVLRASHPDSAVREVATRNDVMAAIRKADAVCDDSC